MGGGDGKLRWISKGEIRILVRTVLHALFRPAIIFLKNILSFVFSTYHTALKSLHISYKLKMHIHFDVWEGSFCRSFLASKYFSCFHCCNHIVFFRKIYRLSVRLSCCSCLSIFFRFPSGTGIKFSYFQLHLK